MDSGIYEDLLRLGYRRSGRHFYKTACEGCAQCIPIRIRASEFEASPSQRRILRKNSDVRVSLNQLALYKESFELYTRYLAGVHGRKDGDENGLASYYSFLVNSGLKTSVLSSYNLDAVEDTPLIANGYLDILPNGISSVYFSWEPACAKRSLGVFSVLREIELCVELKKDYYYLGFWVPGSQSMDYKANYGPAEVALDGEWQLLDADLRTELNRRFP